MGTSLYVSLIGYPNELTDARSIDIDIEGGTTMYYDSFINRIRTLAQGSSKKYYVTGAPQCPFPEAYMGT